MKFIIILILNLTLIINVSKLKAQVAWSDFKNVQVTLKSEKIPVPTLDLKEQQELPIILVERDFCEMSGEENNSNLDCDFIPRFKKMIEGKREFSLIAC